ncbi:unnamed protein product, partial [Rotaria magnacalcarata]
MLERDCGRLASCEATNNAGVFSTSFCRSKNVHLGTDRHEL